MAIPKTPRARFLFMALLIALFAPSAFAQRGATLRGQVTDELGAIIVGASVRLTDEQGKERATVTDGNGQYCFSGLAPGTYALNVAQTGFAV